MHGKEEEGLRMMMAARDGLAFKRFSGIWPQMLADLYVRLGRVDDAVSVIDASILAAGGSGVHL
jgi:hypothetical protein